MWTDYLDIDNEYLEIEEKDFDMEDPSVTDTTQYEEVTEDTFITGDILFPDSNFASETTEDSLQIADSHVSNHERELTENDGYRGLRHKQGCEISFMGYGRCKCGCGSFVGSGNICSACHHSFDAHSRYKK